MSTSAISGPSVLAESSASQVSPNTKESQTQSALNGLPPQFEDLKVIFAAMNARIEKLENEKTLSSIEISDTIHLPLEPAAKRITSIVEAQGSLFIARDTDEPQLLVYNSGTQSINKFEIGFSKKPKIPGRVKKLNVSSDQYVSILYRDGSIEMRDIKTRKCIFVAPSNESSGKEKDIINPANDLISISPSKRTTHPIQVSSTLHAIAGCESKKLDKVCFFDSESKKVWFTPYYLPQSVLYLIPLPGKKIAAAVQDGSIQIIDPEFTERFELRGPIHEEKKDDTKIVQKRSLKKRVNTHTRRKILGLHLLMNQRQIASLSLDQKIKISNISDGKVVADLEGHGATPTCFLEVHDSLVSTDKAGKIIVWDKATYQPKRKVDGHEGEIIGLIDPYGDGSCVITGASDKKVKMWDLTNGSCLRSIYVGAPVTTLSLDRCGRIIVGAGNKIVILENHARPFKASGK